MHFILNLLSVFLDIEFIHTQ